MTRPVAADVDRCPNCEMEYDRCGCWDFSAPPSVDYLFENVLDAGKNKSKRTPPNMMASAFCICAVEVGVVLVWILWRWMR